MVPLADSRKTSPECASLLNLLGWQVVERTVNWHYLAQSLVDCRELSICWRPRLFKSGVKKALPGVLLEEAIQLLWQSRQRPASSPASATSMALGSPTQERYRQRLSNYDDQAKKQGARLNGVPERPEPWKF